MKKRMWLFFVTLCALLQFFTVYIWAAEADIPVSGICGERLTWDLEGGTLRISGSGAMDGYAAGEAPWYSARGQITEVVIGSGVTSVGEHAFSGCRNLTEVTFQGDAPTIGQQAFSGVLSWSNYPSGNGSWTEEVRQSYGGILVWEDYCAHDYMDTVTAPTCTRQGYTTHVCSLCGESHVDSYTEMTAHTMTQWLKTGGYDDVLRSICHRGSALAPENTLAAYELAKKQGFCYVETDVQFTKDGVAVLLHDEKIDRTSNGTGYLSDYTYEELKQFDFGSWKSEAYAGTRLPTFDEFLQICGQLELKPYIELKAGLQAEKIAKLVNLTEAYGMKAHVTWVSFDPKLLETVAAEDPGARLGYLVTRLDEQTVEQASQLMGMAGEVFLDCSYQSLTADRIELVRSAGIPLEVWTVNDEAWFATMDPYISGVTSDTCLAGKILAGEDRGDAEEEQRSCLNCDYCEKRTTEE